MIVAGHVYHLHVNAFDPPKPKLLVLAYIAEDGRLRFFVINSERTELQKTRDEMRKHIIALDPHANDFLTHESWLNCYDLIGGWTAVEAEGEITADPSRHVGILDASAMKVVRETVSGSRLLSERDKELILAQWPK